VLNLFTPYKLSNASDPMQAHSMTPSNQNFRFHSGIEALPDAALILSPELFILSGNKKAQRLLGVRFPEDVGKHIKELLIDPLFSNYLNQDNF